MRLRRSEDFEAVRRNGQHWRDRLLSIGVLPNNLPHNRYGFVVSRRTGSAVVRNRVRRRLRAAVRQWLPALVAGYDVVIIAHLPAPAASFQELTETLAGLFRQAGLLMADGREL